MCGAEESKEEGKSWPAAIDRALEGLVALWHAAGEACQGKEDQQQQDDGEHAH